MPIPWWPCETDKWIQAISLWNLWFDRNTGNGISVGGTGEMMYMGPQRRATKSSTLFRWAQLCCSSQ